MAIETSTTNTSTTNDAGDFHGQLVALQVEFGAQRKALDVTQTKQPVIPLTQRQPVAADTIALLTHDGRFLRFPWPARHGRKFAPAPIHA